MLFIVYLGQVENLFDSSLANRGAYYESFCLCKTGARH